MNIIAIDPGGTETGLVVRSGDRLHYHQTIVERDPKRHVSQVTQLLLSVTGFVADWHIAVEDVNEPNPHMGMTNVRGIIGTARTLGAVLAFTHKAILVPPGGNGSGPLVAYPEALRPTRGSGRGKDGLRHCRSAWDVAGTAAVILRQRRAS